MTTATALIPELDEIVKSGDPKRRAEAARRITELFLQGAANFGSDHVALFDGVLTSLVPHAELAARADLAERLSLLANAPRRLVRQLAHEDVIAIANAKSQGHLLAMAERPKLSPDLTDVMVRRGDRDVIRRAAGNAGAAFSTGGYSTLIKRAATDGVLTLTVGQREDLSAGQLKELLASSIDPVRRRLFDAVKPTRQSAIRQAMNEISGIAERVESRRDFAPAQRTVLALQGAGHLNESVLIGFAKSYKYEESLAALAVMSGIKIATLDQLFAEDRYDPILIVGKMIGLEWATVRALILLRLGLNRVPSPADLEAARANFARLMPSSAERVVGFWKTRQTY